MSMLKESQTNNYSETSSEKWLLLESEERIVEKFKGSRFLNLIYEKKDDKTYLALGSCAIERWDGNQIDNMQQVVRQEYFDLIIKACLGAAHLQTNEMLNQFKQTKNE